MSKTVARLYEQFQPEKYDLLLDVDPDAMTFKGSVVIVGKKVGRPSQRITLHQKGLKITEAFIRRSDKKNETKLDTERINTHDSFDEVRIHTKQKIFPGEHTIMINFEGKITDGMTGMYPCYFKDGDTDKKLIATQFESHHAREVFPCIDEPEAKATFELVLGSPAGSTVLSNTPAKDIKFAKDVDGELQPATKNNATYQRTYFETTPRMSTYLLAFVFGDMHSKSGKTKRGTDVNIWATSAQPASSLDFALDVSIKSIEFFEDYFGVEYPLAKADHVALPDFSSGAMENWGLITYRERVLLAYEGQTGQSTLEQIALVIAHETSHQWFGNLVTMKWWDNLWLNESFANMMEYEAIDAIFPEWHVWNSCIAAEGLSALRRDAIAGVQPVQTDVNHPDEISSLFDPSIVYAKGGRLLYMLKKYVGDDAFRDGLSAYFKKHAYQNTTGDDLWAALSKTSGKDVGAFMNPWLLRNGFPVVTVEQDGGTVKISQSHFVDDPSKSDKDRLWPVPLFADSDQAPDLLDSREATFTAKNPVRIDVGGRGHYIVQYNKTGQALLAEAIKSGELAEPDRLMALNDASMLSKAGALPFGDVLKLLDAYRNEATDSVWGIMSLIIGESRRFIDHDESLEPNIKAFVDKLVTSQVKRLGWEESASDTPADQKLRALVLSLGAYAENNAIVKHATKLFKDYPSDQSAVSPELRSLVFSVPVKNGDAKAVDYLLDLHDSTTNSDLKGDACDALTSTKSSAVAKRLLARLTDNKLVKPQDVDRWLLYLIRNRHTRDQAWQWMVDNWQWLERTFQNDKSFDYLPRYAASAVTTREYQQKFHDLFDDKQDQIILKRNIQLGFEEIETRVSWLERDLNSVQEFFTN